MTPEGEFKRKLILEIKAKYPGAVVLKNNANQIQGFPDHLILFGDRWAAFDAKADRTSPHRPNQPYWIHKLDTMSFAMFVYPQNRKEFLDELQEALGIRGRTRVLIGK